ncbi:MAG TPA: hypothetical protein VGM89_15580 [Puia sp.]|jgi:hypothetical protein
MEQDQLAVLQDFNRNVEWLRRSQAVKDWGLYEDAAMILRRSKEWYKSKRLGRAPALVKGTDWRMNGNRVEYRLASIAALRDALTR